jgi:hypothetical protein
MIELIAVHTPARLLGGLRLLEGPIVKRYLSAAVLVIGLVSLTAGCASGVTGSVGPNASVTAPSVGANHPSDNATTESTPMASPTTDGPATFGHRYTYADGLVVVVAAPTRFRPSEYAMSSPAKAYLSFKITVINGTKALYDPVMFTSSLQSGNAEADEVFDSENGFAGSPSTKLLPGRETVFKLGYGVSNTNDLVLQVAPGFDYDDAMFTS